MALDKLTKIDSQTGIRTTADYTVSDLTVDTVTVKSGGIKMPVGMSTFQNVTVTGELTVEGTTTTLDTNLIGVDRVEVGADSDSVVGVAVTQSGSADIVKLVGSGSTVVTVTTGGNVLVGTTNEGTAAQLLSLYRTGSSSLELRTNTTGNSILHFTDGDPPSGNAAYRGFIEYNHRNDFMRFGTSASGRVWINSAGVGIGTTNPQTKLHILAANPVIRLTDSDQTTDNKSWNISAGTANILRFQAINDAGSSGGGNLFEFYRSGTAINQFRGVKSATPWFVIDNDTRRVGIGTTIPIEKLEVTGNTVIGIVTDKTNYSNTFDASGNGLGVTGVRALNIIDHNAVIKIARNHNNYGSGIDFQHWNLDISTRYGRGLVGIESSSMYLMNTTEEGYIHFNTTPSGGSHTERLRINSGGQVSISGAGTTFGNNTLLNIAPANRTTAFDASDGDTWHDVVIKHGGDATNNAVGLAFEVSADAYHKNAGTGIAAIKNGTDSDYGADLAFITRPQSAVAQERLRITSDGRIGINDSTPNDYELDIMKRSTATDAQIRLYNNGTGSSNDTIMRYQIGGTSAANYIYFGDSGDTNAGQIVYNHGNDSMRFWTGANERLRIDSSGFVGIGTDDPQKTLNVFAGVGTTELIRLSQPVDASVQQNFGIGWCSNNNHTWPGAQITSEEYDVSDPRRSLLFYTRGTNDDIAPTERLRITSAGNVGIGTNTTNELVRIFYTDSTVWPFDSTVSGAPTYTPYSNEVVLHNHVRDTLGSFASIFFRAGSDASGNKIGTARIAAVDTGDYKADLVFGTRNTTFAERLRIKYDGNVGIGTSVPDAPLHVHTTPGYGTIAIFGSNDNTSGEQFECLEIKNDIATYPALSNQSSGDTLDLRSLGSIQATIDSNNNSTGRYFRVSANGIGNTATEYFRVQEDGLVGINSTSPGHQLDVVATTSAVARFERTGGAWAKVDIKAGNNAGNSYLTFSDTDASERGEINYEHNDDSLRFGTAGTENRMTIDSAGRVLVGLTSAMTTGSNDRRDTIQAVHTAGAQLLLGRNDTETSVSNRLGEIAALTNDSGGNGYKVGASIRFEVSATHGSGGDHPTSILFQTCTDGSDTLEERIRVNHDGDLIMTSSQIQKINNTGSLVLAGGDDSNVGGNITVYSSNHGTTSLRDVIRFRNSANECMRIDGSGRLLLGSSSETDRSISDDSTAVLQLSHASTPKMILVRDDTSIVSGNHIGIIDFHSIDAGPVRCARISALATATHQSNDHATALTFQTCADNTSTSQEALRICHDGDVMINRNDANTSNNAILEINSHDIQNKYNYDNTSQYALLIDSHFSGTEDLTTNRTKAGIRIDMEYSGTGAKSNTSGERNALYGVHSTINTTKDTYTAYSGYFFAEAGADDQEESTTVMGVYGYGRNYSIGGSNRSSTIYGGYFLGYRGGDINAGHLYGVYARAHQTTNGSGKGGDITGVYSECEFDEEDINNAYAFRGHMDRDAGTITNGYILYGSFSGDSNFTNRWGIYIGDSAKNYLNGDLEITGTFEKGTDNFRIPHPLVGLTTTKDLVHSVIEGPQMDLIYRGKTDLVAGISTINIDTKAGMTEGTFVALCRDIQCFTSNETGWTNVKGSVTGNKITIIAQDNSCTDTISWMVVGERQDDNAKSAKCTDNDGNLIVEPDKRTDLNDKYQAESEKNIYNIDPNHNPGDDPVEE